jgi:hypothetical protein
MEEKNISKSIVQIFSPDLLRKLDFLAFDAQDSVSLSNGGTYIEFKNEFGEQIELITQNTLIINKGKIIENPAE